MCKYPLIWRKCGWFKSLQFVAIIGVSSIFNILSSLSLSRVYIGMLLKTVTKSVELVSQVLEATHSKLRRNGNNILSNLWHEYTFTKISGQSIPQNLTIFCRTYTLNIDFDVNEMLHKGFLNMIKQSLQ